MEDSVFQAGIN